jgi:hypothetical protein
LQVFGLAAQSLKAPVPFVPDPPPVLVLGLLAPVVLLPPLLLVEHAAAASARATTPASTAFPLWTLTCE